MLPSLMFIHGIIELLEPTDQIFNSLELLMIGSNMSI
jgi:hypothetical protein